MRCPAIKPGKEIDTYYCAAVHSKEHTLEWFGKNSSCIVGDGRCFSRLRFMEKNK